MDQASLSTCVYLAGPVTSVTTMSQSATTLTSVIYWIRTDLQLCAVDTAGSILQRLNLRIRVGTGVGDDPSWPDRTHMYVCGPSFP